MKFDLKKTLSFVLSMAMLLSLTMTAFAAGESNNKGVTFSAELDKSVLTVSEEPQTVKMTIKASEAVSIYSMATNITCDSPITWTAAENETLGLTQAHYNTSAGTISWYSAATDVETTDLAVLTFTIPANTPVGTYEINATNFELADTFGSNIWENSASVSATITVTEAAPEEPEYTDDYYVSIETPTGSVQNDGISTVTVYVNVDGLAENYNSTEIVLSYDQTLLTFKEGICNKNATVKEGQTDQEPSFVAENGILKIRDYGGSLATGGTLYTLTFTTEKGGAAEVELVSSGFSTLEEAASGDLAEAVCDETVAAVTIQHKVTVGGVASYVNPGEAFEYTIPDYNTHDYEYEVTVKKDGVQIEAPTIDEDGNFIIENVDGALEITVTSTAITYYAVTWTDESNVLADAVKVNEVVAGGSVSFDIHENGTEVGEFTYTVKVNNGAITPVTKDSEIEGYITYTISDVAADIAIEIVKEEILPELVAVIIDGAGKDDMAIMQNGEKLTNPASVNENSEVTLVLNPQLGYKYTVKIGDGEVSEKLTEYNQTITITADTTITVTKVWVGDFMEISAYVQLDGKTMWLVQIGDAKIQGLNYTYDQQAFFWSANYASYCYLIVSEDNTAADVVAALEGKIGTIEADATDINYNGNVNGSTNGNNEVIDVNDAQLVWNMYSAVYSDISADVTVEKFLRADLDKSGNLSVSDALAVITKIS